MNDLKYVILNDISAVIFTDCENHSDFRDGFGDVTSAGRVMIDVHEGKIRVQVYGESHTMKMKSKPEDALIINRMFNPPDWL